MPLAREIDYWEDVSKHCVDGARLLKDNVWKRPHQIRKLLEFDWMNQKVLEIGTGNAFIAGALRVILQAHFSYIGTELSPSFRKSAKAMFQLNTVEADVKELPGEGYTRIIAFDSLEHVRPQDRPEGYGKIASVAATEALLFIHFSRSVSLHDKEFDHPFGLEDIVALEGVGFTLNKYDRYQCFNGASEEMLDYVFLVMQK